MSPYRRNFILGLLTLSLSACGPKPWEKHSIAANDAVWLPVGSKMSFSDDFSTRFVVPFAGAPINLAVTVRPYRNVGPFYEWFYPGGVPAVVGNGVVSATLSTTTVNGRPAAQWDVRPKEPADRRCRVVMVLDTARMRTITCTADVSDKSPSKDLAALMTDVANRLELASAAATDPADAELFQVWAKLAYHGAPAPFLFDGWVPYFQAQNFVIWLPPGAQSASGSFGISVPSTWAYAFSTNTGDGSPIDVHIITHRGAGSPDAREFLRKNDALKIFRRSPADAIDAETDTTVTIGQTESLEQELVFRKDDHRAIVYWIPIQTTSEILAIVVENKSPGPIRESMRAMASQIKARVEQLRPALTTDRLLPDIMNTMINGSWAQANQAASHNHFFLKNRLIPYLAGALAGPSTAAQAVALKELNRMSSEEARLVLAHQRPNENREASVGVLPDAPVPGEPGAPGERTINDVMNPPLANPHARQRGLPGFEEQPERQR